MYFVYVIKSLSSGKFYIGQTKNFTVRINQHNGIGKYGSRYTKNKGPWVLIYKEEFKTRSEAMLREKFLKSGKGREFLKKMVESAEAD